MSDLIGTAEAAQRLGVTRRRVLQLIDDGRLHAELAGARTLLVRAADVALLAAQPRHAGRPRKVRS